MADCSKAQTGPLSTAHLALRHHEADLCAPSAPRPSRARPPPSLRLKQWRQAVRVKAFHQLVELVSCRQGLSGHTLGVRDVRITETTYSLTHSCYIFKKKFGELYSFKRLEASIGARI